jgi:ketosteroid isomerase-like protein
METLLNLIGGADFKKDRTSEEFRKQMLEAFAPDIEVHEPPCLPHGGVHKGRDNWLEVRRTMMSLWDQKLDVLHIWEVPGEDVIVLNYMMDWTAKSTDRNVRIPAVEVLTFRDGAIAKVEFYPQDAKAILDTLA